MSNYIGAVLPQKERIQLCQPQEVIISDKFTGVLTVSRGICRLQERLRDVLAFRVKYFNVSFLSTDLDANQGVLMGLFSDRLAANVQQSNFRLGAASDTGDSTATAVPMVAWMVRHGTTNNFVSSASLSTAESNSLQRFASPTHIDEFDWLVSPLNQAFPSPVAHAYSIEMVIEFFSVCRCQSTLHVGPYG